MEEAVRHQLLRVSMNQLYDLATNSLPHVVVSGPGRQTISACSARQHTRSWLPILWGKKMHRSTSMGLWMQRYIRTMPLASRCVPNVLLAA